MASFNKVILMGNVTRDPEVRYTTGGSAVTEIGIAVNRFWTDRNTNERKEETTFVDVTLWGRTAEIAGEYLGKGRPVLIEGRLQLDQWEDRETGQKRSKLRVVGESMQLLGGRSEGGGGQGGGGGQSRGGYNAAPQQAPQQAAPSAPAAPSASAGKSPDQAFYDDPPTAGDDDVPF
ncbi:MAG: single-stranded DNA-binding protein [Planctomycetaceae bacterium]|nr:single-stranded DNA-binding protein [Planctomycetaceae bacterium]